MKYSKPNNCLGCSHKSAMLKSLNLSDINKIPDSCLTIKYKKGETIIKQNSKVTHAIYVAQGFAKLYIEQGLKKLTIKYIRKGSYIGLHTIFDEDYYTFSASTLENSQICLIDIKLIQSFAQQNLSYLNRLAASISSEYNFMLKRFNDLNNKKIKGRLASALLYFSEDFFVNIKFELPISRRELADFTGMSTENAVRLLTEFKKSGLIEINGKSIYLKEIEVIKKIADDN